MLLIIIGVMCTPPRARKNQNQRRKREEKLSYFAREMLCFKEIYQELEIGKKIARGVVHINFGGKFQVGSF